MIIEKEMFKKKLHTSVPISFSQVILCSDNTTQERLPQELIIFAKIFIYQQGLFIVSLEVSTLNVLRIVCFCVKTKCPCPVDPQAAHWLGHRFMPIS